MKKLITIVLTLVMVFSMAACGSSEDGESGQQAGAPITVISREDGSGTRGAFTELMGITIDDVDHTTQMAEISQSTSVVMATVAGVTLIPAICVYFGFTYADKINFLNLFEAQPLLLVSASAAWMNYDLVLFAAVLVAVIAFVIVLTVTAWASWSKRGT